MLMPIRGSSGLPETAMDLLERSVISEKSGI